MNSRQLTEAESKVVSLLRNFDDIAMKGRLTQSLYMNPQALEHIQDGNVAKLAKVLWDGDKEMYLVTFSIFELKKYLDYCCEMVGMTVTVDGKIKTFDGMTLVLEDDQ